MLHLAEKLQYISPQQAAIERENAEILSKRIAAFIRTLKK